ncbi:hypothetical protein Droror1_Dr00028282, partial [Drosera rotundifolia]
METDNVTNSSIAEDEPIDAAWLLSPKGTELMYIVCLKLAQRSLGFVDLSFFAHLGPFDQRVPDLRSAPESLTSECVSGPLPTRISGSYYCYLSKFFSLKLACAPLKEKKVIAVPTVQRKTTLAKRAEREPTRMLKELHMNWSSEWLLEDNPQLSNQ